jgi:hypothetical protein
MDEIMDEVMGSMSGMGGVLGAYGSYLTFTNPYKLTEEQEAVRKEKLKAFWVKWENLQNLPRKKKKKEKKWLLLEYSILTWDPMKDMFNF